MSADIDIDFANRQDILKHIKHTAARQTHNDVSRPHNSGVYVTPIPYDPVLNCAAIDYEEAEQRGYFKIDFLNVTVYQMVRSEEHLTELMNTEPPWSRLWTDPTWASQLVHVGGHIDLLQSMQPDSIPRMAALIAIIRPGKAHLRNKPWEEVFKHVWERDDSEGYSFKRAHAISYAVLVALQMNLLNTFD